ncbi:MAG: integrase arm-type DNA-binding domain-containing protein [Acidobacteriota bacterium]
MPKVHLTDAKVRSLKAMPPGKQRSYYDTKVPGFGMRVGSGARTWFLRYRTPTGTRRRFTLGRYPDLSLKKAREQAIIARGRLATGDDPAAKTASRRRALTVHSLVERYRRDHLAKLKPETQKGYNILLDRYIEPCLGRLEVEAVEPMDLHEMVQKVPGSVQPNRCLDVASRVFSFAVALGLAKLNPAASLKRPFREKPRQRVLSDDEIRAVWLSAAASNSLFRFAIQLWILTGMRKSELLALEWDHVSTTQVDGQPVPAIHVPARLTKQGRDHLVILSRQAQRVLEALRTLSGDGRWLFPSPLKSGHLSSPLSYVSDLREDSGVDGWSPHDLRRTASTILGRLGIQDKINDLVLGHKIRGVLAQHYNHHTYGEELRDAWQALGDHIEGLVGAAQIAPRLSLAAPNDEPSASRSSGTG